ncbi:MAG: 6-phosphofructokinase [Acidobacteriota bacterium]
MLKGVAVVAHGGGPTQVINASLAGVIEECRRHERITALYGARHGILGVLNDDFLDLARQAPALVTAIGATPGSALGSCRRRVGAEDYDRILAVFRAHNVRYFFYTGGNDSMDTSAHVARLASERGYEMCVVGIPKTIDNDLAETDHCPGYGSAALYYACAVRDIGADIRELPDRITVVEVMGRNAGWLTAATALARCEPGDPPHLIYFPERPISAEKFLADVEAVYRRLGHATIAVCEGQKDDKGEPFGADLVAADGFGWQMAGNLAHALSRLITRHLKLRARSEKPGLLGRTSAEFVSAVDRQEARLCGKAAVEAAVRGVTGMMVTLVREPGPVYRATTGLVDLEKVANSERRLPLEWIHPEANDVLQTFLEYAAPLVGPITPRARL